MRPIADSGQMDKLFTAYTEHAFMDELGIADPRLIDYLAHLLIRFVHRDQIFPSHSPQRHPSAILDLIDEAERSEKVGSARRELFRQIGDFALFWTGVFPEAVHPRRSWDSAGIEHYTEQGKRSYYFASTYRETAELADEAPLLERLSHDFELCAVGLRRARDLWESDSTAPPPSI